jgi:ribosomal protein S18 acetylase RimI-like enzyme
MFSVKLVEATYSDIEKMIEFELATLTNPTEYDVEWVEKDAKESFPDTRMIVKDGEQIGMLTAYKVDDWWYIGEIYLVPEWRRKGIGRAVMQHEIDAHEKLLLRVMPDNTHAVQLYKSLGFTWTDEFEPVSGLVYMSLEKDD